MHDVSDLYFERCHKCDSETGRAGIGEDSLHFDGNVFCEVCYYDEYIAYLEQQLYEAKSKIPRTDGDEAFQEYPEMRVYHMELHNEGCEVVHAGDVLEVLAIYKDLVATAKEEIDALKRANLRNWTEGALIMCVELKDVMRSIKIKYNIRFEEKDFGEFDNDEHLAGIIVDMLIEKGVDG